MATNSRGKTELAIQKRYQDRETSPERTIVWIERKSNNEQKALVVFYLSRNGQLEHPHFLEIPLSSPQGLFLKDVINKLNTLRGDGMANRFSWSSERSYKNGFVWQDLSENDFIYPFHGRECILKGSLLLETSLSFRSYETVFSTSSISKNSSETYSSSEDSNVVAKTRRKHHSWSEFKELDKMNTKSIRPKSGENLAAKATMCQHRQMIMQGKEDSGLKKLKNMKMEANEGIMERNGLQASRPSSNSNSEILKSVNISADIRDLSVENDRPSGRIKASAVLMQLIACGSRRVKDWESMEIRG